MWSKNSQTRELLGEATWVTWNWCCVCDRLERTGEFTEEFAGEAEEGLNVQETSSEVDFRVLLTKRIRGSYRRGRLSTRECAEVIEIKIKPPHYSFKWGNWLRRLFIYKSQIWSSYCAWGEDDPARSGHQQRGTGTMARSVRRARNWASN